MEGAKESKRRDGWTIFYFGCWAFAGLFFGYHCGYSARAKCVEERVVDHQLVTNMKLDRVIQQADGLIDFQLKSANYDLMVGRMTRELWQKEFPNKPCPSSAS